MTTPIDYEALVAVAPIHYDPRSQVAACSTCAAHGITSTHRIVYDVRLDRFLHDQGIVPRHLAPIAGTSRHSLRYYRAGVRTPRASELARLTEACRQILGDWVRASHLLYLGELEDAELPPSDWRRVITPPRRQ